jgi:hypothetical protein
VPVTGALAAERGRRTVLEPGVAARIPARSALICTGSQTCTYLAVTADRPRSR